MPDDKRIVSLISSATEIVCALGLAQKMVARSHECDYPSSVLKLPSVTSPKFPTDGTSYQIDQRVKAILQEGLSVYRVDAESLKSLNPSHLITQTQCHICAVSLRDVQSTLNEWLKNGATIVNLDGMDFEGVLLDIRKVATALDVVLEGENLIRAIKSRLQKIWDSSRKLTNKTAFLVEWIDPLLSAEHWMPQLAEMAGITLRTEKLFESDPDLIVFAPCGWGLERTEEELRSISLPRQWRELRAVKENQVFLADGNQFFNRPGPRLVETTEILAEIAHPTVFSFGHKNSSWRQFQGLGNLIKED